MDRLVYTSLSALRGAMARQTTTANNLANVNTSGFRAEIAGVNPVWLDGGPFQSRAQSTEQVLGADMRPGAVSDTGRDLDVAMEGDALLTVQAPDGEEAYTRRGDLQTTETGLLITGDGHPVQGEQGPITLPPAQSIKIDKDGTIWVTPVGGEANEPTRLDRLKLASATGSNISKGLDGLFRVQGGGALPADPDARLQSGSIEGSNVETSKALVDMIEASRAYDTQIQLITATRDIDTSAADLMRLPD